MSHLKRAAMPAFWPAARKGLHYVIHPTPGPHPIRDSVPLRVVIRDFFRYAGTAKEADRAIKQGMITVDGKPRKDPGFPVGLMDSVELAGMPKAYRLVPDAEGFAFIEVNKSEAAKKPCKIIGKTTLKGGASQLNLHDGRNVIAKGPYRPGDTVVIALPGQKIEQHISFKEGEKAIVTDGKNRGAVGKIKSIRERKTMTEKASVMLDVDGDTVTTLKGYVMVGSFPAPPVYTRRRELRKARAKAQAEAVKEMESKKKRPAAKKTEPEAAKEKPKAEKKAKTARKKKAAEAEA